MKMLKVVLAILMLAGTSTMAQAQAPQGQGQRGGGRNMMAAMFNGITLTAEQQVQVDSIAKKYADARQAMMADESIDRETRRTKGRELMTKQQDDIKALLTPEQKTVFEKNMADMQARRGQGGGRPPRR